METITAKTWPNAAILSNWWREVKDNFWEEDARPHVKMLVKDLMEHTLKEDIGNALKRDWDEIIPYRNGYYSRNLVSQYGLIPEVRVPRLRNVSYKTRVFKRYKRHQDIVEDLIEDIFLKGISTRKVGDCVQRLLGENLKLMVMDGSPGLKAAAEVIYLDEMLSFFDCPEDHWIKIRTTNAIERSFREVRRRTRVFSCFTDRDSSERLIYAIFVHLNNSWKGKPLQGFTQFN